MGAPEGSVDCDPEVKAATKTVFYLVNNKKPNNYIYGEVTTGYLDFIVYNLPADKTGCPGRWLFQQMWAHFMLELTAITAIVGNWSGASTNLIKVNNLTSNNAMTLENAATQTNTGQYATTDVGYTHVTVIYPSPNTPFSVATRGTQGKYTQVVVHFTR